MTEKFVTLLPLARRLITLENDPPSGDENFLAVMDRWVRDGDLKTLLFCCSRAHD